MVGGRYSIVEDGAIAVVDGAIAWLGARLALPSEQAAATHDARGAWVTPGLIDCHTHLVYGGDRSREFELRLEGASYEEIALAGGGIRSTMRATRAASEDELYRKARTRLNALAAEGVVICEIKSGYGLNTATELKQLRVARRLGETGAVTVRTKLLAAHALPPEFDGRPDDYIELVCSEIIPQAHYAGLADAVDAFSERIAFSVEQTTRVFACAQRLGLPVKLHADQLSDMQGAALAARFGALSADHLEYASAAGVAALAAGGTVAVLLPGAFYFLREKQLPPIAALRRHQVPIAISTDCNPGSSPTTSLLLMMNMACTLFRLTPEEALAGVTLHAARALGMTASHGSLEVGKRADFVLWDISTPAQLSYAMGANPRVATIRGGTIADDVSGSYG